MVSREKESVKFFITWVLVIAICAVQASAQSGDTIEVLDSWGNKILSLIRADWVKAICALGFAIEGGAMIYTHQQGGSIKALIPVMIGTIVLLSASGIASFFFGTSN